MFKEITAEAVLIRHIEDAHRLITLAFEAAILKRKPVYIEVACNLANVPIPPSVPFQLERRFDSNPDSLKAAVEAVAARLNQADKPALVAGVKLRAAMATAAFHELANISGYATAIMPNAKGLLSEDVPHYMTPGLGNQRSFWVAGVLTVTVAVFAITLKEPETKAG